MKKRGQRMSLFFSLFIAAIAFTKFTNLAGSENVRPIHIVTLMAAGMGIGVFLVNLFMMLKNKDK